MAAPSTSDTNITAEIGAVVAPSTDKAFKELDERIDVLMKTADGLDKSLGKIFTSSGNVAKSIDRATRGMGTLSRTMKSLERSTLNSNLAQAAHMRQQTSGTRTTQQQTSATNTLTRAKDDNAKATERQRKAEERWSDYLDKKRPKAGAGMARAEAFASGASSFGNKAGIAAGIGAAGIGASWKSAMDVERTLTAMQVQGGIGAGDMGGIRSELQALTGLKETNMNLGELAELFKVQMSQGKLDKTKALSVTRMIARSATATGQEGMGDDMGRLAHSMAQEFGIKDLSLALDMVSKGQEFGKVKAPAFAQGAPKMFENARASGMTGQQDLGRLLALTEIVGRGSATGEEGMSSASDFLMTVTDSGFAEKLKSQLHLNKDAVWMGAQRQGADPILAMVNAINERTQGDYQDEKLEKLLGRRHIKGFREMVEHRSDYDAIVKATNNSKGTVDAKFNTVTDSPAARMKQLMDSLSSISRSVGILFAPAMARVASVLETVSRVVVGFTNKFPTLSSAIGTGAVAFVGLVAVAAIAAKTVGLVTRGFIGMASAMTMFSARAKRFKMLTEMRGGISANGTYLSGFGNSGRMTGRRGGLGRPMVRGSRLGNWAGMAAEIFGYGDAADMVSFARDGFGVRRAARAGVGGAASRGAGLAARGASGGLLARLFGGARGLIGRAGSGLMGLAGGALGFLRMPSGKALSGGLGATKGLWARGAGLAGRGVSAIAGGLNTARFYSGMMLARLGNVFQGGAIRTMFTRAASFGSRIFSRQFAMGAIRMIPAGLSGLGTAVGTASIGAVAGTVAAGAALGYAISKGINHVAKKTTGRSVSETLADGWTAKQDSALYGQNSRSTMLYGLSAGMLRSQGHEADAERKIALAKFKAEVDRINDDIKRNGDSAAKRVERKYAQQQVDRLQKQLDGTETVGVVNARTGQMAARGGTGGDFNDHSNITIVIEGGKNMTTNEMAQATAKALAEAARKQHGQNQKVIRGSYHDGVATKG